MDTQPDRDPVDPDNFTSVGPTIYEEARRARRDHLLKEWAAAVTPLEAKAQWADTAAVDFAMLGIKSLYLLHGGALVALPVFHEKLALESAVWIPPIWLAAVIYILGLCTTTFLNVVCYLAMGIQAESTKRQREATAGKISLSIYGEHGKNNAAHIKETERAAARHARCFRVLRRVAILLAALSNGLFIGGSLALLNAAR